MTITSFSKFDLNVFFPKFEVSYGHPFFLWRFLGVHKKLVDPLERKIFIIEWMNEWMNGLSPLGFLYQFFIHFHTVEFTWFKDYNLNKQAILMTWRKCASYYLEIRVAMLLSLWYLKTRQVYTLHMMRSSWMLNFSLGVILFWGEKLL